VEEAIPALAFQRVGWFFEIAGGLAWRFEEADWARREFDRYGLWATLSYEGADSSLFQLSETHRLSPLATVRYLSDAVPAEPDDQAALDAGLRLILTSTRYAFSLEYLLRNREDDTDYRLASVVDFHVGGNVWLQASFGKDFGQERGGDLLARLSLSLALTGSRYGSDAGP
jgi:hypothetical protein